MRTSLLVVLALVSINTQAADPAKGLPAPSEDLLNRYFADQVRQIASTCLADIRSPRNWQDQRAQLRRQLAEMLGLWPAPEKTDLQPRITGSIDQPAFTVENLFFQSQPGLYVTGNLYLPKNLTVPAPTILYVCGHGTVKKNGIAYGAKSVYQHHGAWFARNGYVCLVIDTLQLGEIEGIHHGTYREGMWWWHSRGYTPAGVEAWNSIRAIDYLCTRPEVDKERIGITGRSGGGAYSWWTTALDDRVKVAVPVAGITDLHNHVVDGTVEGHCDCMFMVNTYRWDYGMVAALASPRALLISNTDKDNIFPLDGVYRVHQWARKIYDLENASNKHLGLIITEGPHKDTQALQVPAFGWFNRHFKQDEKPIELIATKLFEPEQLKVFKQLPAGQKNTTIQESFVPQAPVPAVPGDDAAWRKSRDHWMKQLAEQSFRGWPREVDPVAPRQVLNVTRDGLSLLAFDFESEPQVPLRLFILQQSKLNDPEMVVLNVLDEEGYAPWLAEMAAGFATELETLSPPPPDARSFDLTKKMLNSTKWVMAYVAPRGVGPLALTNDARKRTQILRRYYLIGQTLEGMQVWDVRRSVQSIRGLPQFKGTAVWLQAYRRMAGVTLYASLFEEPVSRLDLHALPASHMSGPHFLNVLRFMDVDAALALAAQRSRVVLYGEAPQAAYARETAQRLNLPQDQIQIRPLSK